MGQLSRARRIRDDDRDRAGREIKAAVGAIPDARLTELFDYQGPENAPPPSAFNLSYRVLWRAMGQPRAMSPEDGAVLPGLSDEERSDINRRMIRVVQPLLDRIEVLDNRGRNR